MHEPAAALEACSRSSEGVGGHQSSGRFGVRAVHAEAATALPASGPGSGTPEPPWHVLQMHD